MLNFKRTKNLNTLFFLKNDLNWLWKNFIDFSNTIRLFKKSISICLKLCIRQKYKNIKNFKKKNILICWQYDIIIYILLNLYSLICFVLLFGCLKNGTCIHSLCIEEIKWVAKTFGHNSKFWWECKKNIRVQRPSLWLNSIKRCYTNQKYLEFYDRLDFRRTNHFEWILISWLIKANNKIPRRKLPFLFIHFNVFCLFMT